MTTKGGGDGHEELRADAPLLSDDEFAALIAAEHAARGDDLDEARQRRLLKRIEDALPAPAPAGAPRLRVALWAGPLAAAALVYFGLSSFLLKDDREQQRVKGAEGSVPARLLAYAAKGAGDLRPYDGQALAAGETLVFDVNLTQPGVAALVVRAGREPMRVAYRIAVARAGEDTPLARGGEGYGFRPDAGGGDALLCVVAAADEAALAQVLEFLPPRLSELPAEACVEARAP